MDKQNQELDGLFAAYRNAVPDPEAGANFMPELWRKIEARQRMVIRIKKLTQVFVAAAAAICLLFGILLEVPARQAPVMRGNYVDVLADANPTENLSALGIIRVDYTESNAK